VNGKEAGSYLEEHLAGIVEEMTSQKKQFLEELFELCQEIDSDELRSFWERMENQEPRMTEWLESRNIEFGQITPAAWVRKLAEEQRKRAA